MASQFANSQNQPSFSQTATNFPTLSASQAQIQLSITSDQPPPDAFNTLRHPAQIRMLEMLKNYDLPAILDEVRRLDEEFAPKLEQSRIKNHDFERQGLLFLAGTEQLFGEAPYLHSAMDCGQIEHRNHCRSAETNEERHQSGAGAGNIHEPDRLRERNAALAA